MVRDVSGYEVEALHQELLRRDIMATAEKLPAFPDIIWKVMPLIQRMAPVSEIEAVIRYDQTITARVLTLSQSAYYRRKTRVDSLKDAIVTLGGQKLVQVILTASAARYFDRQSAKYDRAEQDLWYHSVATAVMSEMIARGLRQQKVLKTYMAGLLHDIGRPVLNLYYKIYSGVDMSGMDKNRAEMLETERRTVGIDHQALGKAIAMKWRLPCEVVEAIGYHHCPLQAQNDQEVVAVVYAANNMVLAMAAGEETEKFNPDNDEVFKELGITTRKVELLQQRLTETMEDIRSFLISGSNSHTPNGTSSEGCTKLKEKREIR